MTGNQWTNSPMNKYILTFSDGSLHPVWATDKKAARFHLEPLAKKHKLSITKVELIKKPLKPYFTK